MNHSGNRAWLGFTLALAAAHVVAGPRDLGREVIDTNDGWGSVPTETLPNGTTGGALATSDRVHTVTNRNDLVAALAYPDATPKIIHVAGIIDANVDADGNALSCTDITGRIRSPARCTRSTSS